MADETLIVTYDCSGCFEHAESDDEGGFICRRCFVRFDGFSDGTEGESMTRAEFVEYFGDRPPKPSRRESMDELLRTVRGRR